MLVTSRSAAEYRAMFDLSDDDLAGATVLDCCAGGSDFVAGTDTFAVAVDPAYANDSAELGTTIRDSLRDGTLIIDQNAEHFDWSWYGGPEQRARMRTEAAEHFLADLKCHPDRYVAGALPHLPFADGAFDLVLCSHLLFTWSHEFGLDWHRAAIGELVRVNRWEVRVFPLLVSGTGAAVPFLPELRAELERVGCRSEVRRVPYRFQRGGDEMLVVSARAGRSRRVR